MRKTLTLAALALCLASTAHAGRRDGDGSLIQKKKQPSVVAMIVAAITGNGADEGRKD